MSLFLFSLFGLVLFLAIYAVEDGEFPPFGLLVVMIPLAFLISMSIAAYFSIRSMSTERRGGVVQHALILWGTAMTLLAVPTTILLNQAAVIAARGLTQGGILLGAAGAISEASPRLESRIHLLKGRVENRVVSDRGQPSPAQTVKRTQEKAKAEIKKPEIQSIVKPWVAGVTLFFECLNLGCTHFDRDVLAFHSGASEAVLDIFAHDEL